MKRQQILNEEKGKHISDLEAFLSVARKLIIDRIEENPKAGIILAKGNKNERKVRYSDALRYADSLESFLGTRGMFSIGVCQTCKYLDRKPIPDSYYGKCKIHKITVHEYESCLEHSKEGGGYGV